jgi:hypothetical protein
MSEQRLQAFLRFSAEVTAFPVVELLGTGNARAFMETVDRIVGPAVLDDLIQVYAGLGDLDGAARQRGLRRELFGDERLGPIARNIIKLWYVGIWYQLPAAWRERWGARAGDLTRTVSPNAYTEGLLWPACGAHPAGARAPGYGSWVGPPEIPPIPFAADPEETR